MENTIGERFFFAFIPWKGNKMTTTGWRLQTPELLQAERYAKIGEALAISKTKAIVAFKRVANPLGLKAADILLLDILVSFTQEKDWEAGQRPLVWASNAYLMEQTGFSLTALRRHLRLLIENGLIWVKDSANGQRYGRRNENGYIIEAYGFDLAPLAARSEEFNALYEELVAERNFIKSLKRHITIQRRTVWALLDKMRQTAPKASISRFRADYERLVEALSCKQRNLQNNNAQLLDLLDAFKALKKELEFVFEEAATVFETDEAIKKQNMKTNKNFQNMAPMGHQNGRSIQVTNELKNISKFCNEKEKQNGEIALENQEAAYHSKNSSLNLETIMISCPHFANLSRELGFYLKDWRDFHQFADKARAIAGISYDAWQNSQEAMGPLAASASIALIFDKYSEGSIKSPGGYLRGLVEKQKTGDLHLERSFYGRMS